MICYETLSTNSSKKCVCRSVWRNYIWILGLKGIRLELSFYKSQTEKTIFLDLFAGDQRSPVIVISRLLLRMHGTYLASLVWTSTKNEWMHKTPEQTRVLTIHHVKLTQSTAFEQECFELPSLLPTLLNLWLLLVLCQFIEMSYLT